MKFQFLMHESSSIYIRPNRNSTSNPMRVLRRRRTKLSEFRRTNSLVNPAFEVTYRTHVVARGAFCVRMKLANSHSQDRRETSKSVGPRSGGDPNPAGNPQNCNEDGERVKRVYNVKSKRKGRERAINSQDIGFPNILLLAPFVR